MSQTPATDALIEAAHADIGIDPFDFDTPQNWLGAVFAPENRDLLRAALIEAGVIEAVSWADDWPERLFRFVEVGSRG